MQDIESEASGLGQAALMKGFSDPRRSVGKITDAKAVGRALGCLQETNEPTTNARTNRICMQHDPTLGKSRG